MSAPAIQSSVVRMTGYDDIASEIPSARITVILSRRGGIGTIGQYTLTPRGGCQFSLSPMYG